MSASPRNRPQWYGTAPPPWGMMNRMVGKSRKMIRGDHLHHRGGVRPEVVRARGVEGGVAGGAHVDHRGHVELHHLLVERIPPAIAERRVGPVAAARVRVQVAADEAELPDAALELTDAGVGRHPGGLRELGDAGEVLGVELGDPVDEVVAVLGPRDAGGLVADVMAHPARAGREDGQVRAALALEPELGAFEALADLVVGDADLALDVAVQRILGKLGLLALAVFAERVGGGGVVAVAVDDHGGRSHSRSERLSTYTRPAASSFGRMP